MSIRRMAQQVAESFVNGGAPEREAGQATVEYALVVLAAAAIALLVIAWAARTGKIGDLFDRVFDQVVGKAG